jgi:hypothetical protein
VVEWANKCNNYRYGFWINNSDKRGGDVTTKFKKIAMKITTMPKVFKDSPSIIRFYWSESDIRELQMEKEFCPYISVSGTYYIDLITYPAKSGKYKTWDLREVIGNKYKFLMSDNKDSYAQNIKFRFQIQLPPKIFVSNMENVLVGRFNEDTKSWEFEAKNKEVKEGKIVSFWSTDVGIYSLLIDRTTYFPYKSWRLRSVGKNIAVLNLESLL